jgi:hypothetical protein
MGLCNRIVARSALVGFSLLNACAWFRPRTPPKSESVDFRAPAEIIAPGDSLIRVRAVATNSGSLTWTLELGPCSMNTRVASLAPAAVREWDFERWRIAVNPRAACVGYRVTYPLPPGGSVATSELERIVRVRDILGDSLPAGRYRVTASVSFSNQSPIEVAAGEVDLRSPA